MMERSNVTQVMGYCIGREWVIVCIVGREKGETVTYILEQSVTFSVEWDVVVAGPLTSYITHLNIQPYFPTPPLTLTLPSTLSLSLNSSAVPPLLLFTSLILSVFPLHFISCTTGSFRSTAGHTAASLSRLCLRKS